jgi:hypothetical protein
MVIVASVPATTIAVQQSSMPTRRREAMPIGDSKPEATWQTRADGRAHAPDVPAPRALCRRGTLRASLDGMWRAIREALRRVFARAPHPHAHHPRVVHRIALDCTHGHGRIQIDLLLGADGRPATVLRSADRPHCEPCAARCLRSGEARREPDVVLLLPSDIPVDEID